MASEDANSLNLAEARRAHDNEAAFGRDANQAAINSGAETLKALLYLNGGSCVVMLAFIGTLASKDKPISAFGSALLVFAFGAGLVVLANASGYFTNLLISGTSFAKERTYSYPFLKDTPTSNKRYWWGEFFRYLAIILALSGLGAFFIGLCLSYGAFRSL